jgi:hypothetical protein
MKNNAFVVGSVALGIFLAAPAFAFTAPPTSGPAKDGQPAWHLQPAYSGAGGHMSVDDQGRVTVTPRAGNGAPRRAPTVGNAFGCSHSTVCTRTGGPGRENTLRVVWSQNLGYTFSYPFHLPPGDGGIPAVTVDSKDNVWVLQRSPKGSPQLFKFDKNGALLITVSPDVIGYQEKGHGMAVDANDNVWFVDETGATVSEVSSDGKLLKTVGVKDKPGDWDEAKGQHLLWQPTAVTFAPNGDMYISEGHGNESPNNVDSDDPANVLGASRVLHFDKSGALIGQWFGDDVGQGKFEMIHGMAVDPKTGDVWLGDREQYRIVIYSGDGKFLRTIQMRNLTCDIEFDRKGNPWVATGQDGQILKIDRNGKVLGALGGGMGIAPGQFSEAGFFGFDKDGVIYSGDTGIPRVAKLTPPGKSKH